MGLHLPRSSDTIELPRVRRRALLELGSLRRAVQALDRALLVTARSPSFAALDPFVQETLRAGVIQCFEVAYEQSWKMMRRWIETNVGAEGVDGVTRRELFRRAAEERLIDDVERWMSYHFTRNLTSHTYDEASAQEAYAQVIGFLPLAEDLLARLEARND